MKKNKNRFFLYFGKKRINKKKYVLHEILYLKNKNI